jgi:hypothetical protein
MRFDSCEEILEDFSFLKSLIVALPEDNFPYMTKNEIQEEKVSWIEEIKMEYAFKLLTRMEAEIRMEFNQTISSKRRDSLSRDLSELCDEYRRETGDLFEESQTGVPSHWIKGHSQAPGEVLSCSVRRFSFTVLPAQGPFDIQELVCTWALFQGTPARA